MKRILLFLSLLAVCGTVTARPTIRVDKAPGSKRVSFYLEGKTYPGTLTVYVMLKDVYNCEFSPGETKYEVRTNGSYHLLTLRADDESYGVGYSYSWRCVYGRMDPPVDTAFVYRMPCTAGKPVRVIGTEHVLDKYCKSHEQRQQLGYAFPLEKGDTVYAMRRGVVTQVVRPEQRPSGTPAVSFTTRSVRIFVEQPDGSDACYTCFDPDHVLVCEGEEVLPGMPLGLAGTYDGEHYKVSVQVSWRVSEQNGEGKLSVGTRHCLFRFATAEGVVVPESGKVYTPVMTDSLLTCEMSKKELKRWRSGQGR